MNITKDQIQELLTAQDTLNAAYDCPEWRDNNHPFCDYIWIETGEMLGHHNQMFHYRKGKPDWPQVHLELVDILHFGLSVMLIKGETAEDAVGELGVVRVGLPKPTASTIRLTKEIAKDALAYELFSLGAFANLCDACETSFEEIAKRYFLKYTLNKFRIDNGQTRGEYTKIWFDGREDNEHLVELAGRLNGDLTMIKYHLTRRYEQTLAKQSANA